MIELIEPIFAWLAVESPSIVEWVLRSAVKLLMALYVVGFAVNNADKSVQNDDPKLWMFFIFLGLLVLS